MFLKANGNLSDTVTVTLRATFIGGSQKQEVTAGPRSGLSKGQSKQAGPARHPGKGILFLTPLPQRPTPPSMFPPTVRRAQTHPAQPGHA